LSRILEIPTSGSYAREDFWLWSPFCTKVFVITTNRLAYASSSGHGVHEGRGSTLQKQALPGPEGRDGGIWALKCRSTANMSRLVKFDEENIGVRIRSKDDMTTTILDEMDSFLYSISSSLKLLIQQIF